MRRPILPAYVVDPAEARAARALALLIEGACMAVAMSAATVLRIEVTLR